MGSVPIRSAVVLVAGMVLVLGLPARADRSIMKDVNDVSGRLDIDELHHGHADEGFKHRISTFSPWPSRLLRRRATEFDLWMDLDADGSPDRVVYFGFRNKRLYGEMNTYESDGDGAHLTVLGLVTVRRPNRSSLVAVIPKRWVKGEPYRWYVSSFFLGSDQESECGTEYACQDKAPDSGWIKH